MIERFLTTEQVATILQVHPFTILKLIKHGKITGVKIGKGYRIQESEVKRFLEERMVSPKKSGKKDEIFEVKHDDGEVHKIDDMHLKGGKNDGEHFYII
jgi:excisionase family DNA binding protein